MESLGQISVNSVQLVLSVLYLFTILSVCLVIIFENRPPVETMSWVLVILLIPFAGLLLYIFIGKNFRKSKIFSRKGLIDSEYLFAAATEQKETIREKLRDKAPSVRSKSHLMTLMLNNSKAMLTEYNEVDILTDGKETFPAMLKAIVEAKKYIHLEFFRFDIDHTGNTFRNVLMDKAREGVEVRVIIDDVGSWSFKSKHVKEMRRAGVEIFCFMPVSFPRFTSKINYRNHRKILVVDGEKGFVGGLNIADKYLNGLPEIGPWRDTHLEVRGEAVASMNMVFLIDWYFVSNDILTREDKYFTTANTPNKCLMQLATSGPDSDYANIMQLYFSAISTAKDYIYLCTPYFSPNDTILTALKTAALSGVDVRLLIPEKSDSVIGNWNTRSYINEILEAGVRVYLYKSGFIHSKFLVVDKAFSSVGSANLDMRSFNLDFEVSALIYDAIFADKLKKMYLADLENSVEVLPELWRDRRRSEKYRESLSRILGPLY